MDPLKNLLTFIKLKDNEDERCEVRSHVLDHLDDYAPAFGVSIDTLRDALTSVDDDRALVKRLKSTIDSHKSKAREKKLTTKSSTAQASADALASVAYWEGEQLHFDLLSLLASALTKPGDLMVFDLGDEREVCIPMRLLIDLDRLERSDLTAYVTREALVVRWGANGRMRLISKPEPSASRIIFTAPARSSVAA